MIKREVLPTKAIIICHGKSEYTMCQFIKSNLRLKIELIAEDKGSKSIQITSILHILNGLNFKTFSNFTRAFPDVKKVKQKIDSSFKVFIIMDTDDCSPSQKEAYINKSMFKGHFLYENIIPIYNTLNLEDVLEESKIPFTKKGSERKKEYISIFPIDQKHLQREHLQVKDFIAKLKSSKQSRSKSNLYVLLDFFLQNP